ncbi:MAG: hypothetical protein QXY07_02640 [Candidatus Bathyarchaeia archaeon]
MWICLFCGKIFREKPESCPVCFHTRIEMAKPYHVRKTDDKIIHTTICPICGERNYFIQIGKKKDEFGELIWTWADDYHKCEHFYGTKLAKIGMYWRKVAVYKTSKTEQHTLGGTGVEGF